VVTYVAAYTSLFWRLHLATSPVALCAALARAPAARNKEAAAAAVAGLREAIRRSRGDHAVSAARALLVVAGPAKAIAKLKRDGVLRASSFDFHAPAIASIVDDWVDHALDYGIGLPEVVYLTSVANLCRLAPSVRTLYRDTVAQLRGGRGALLKSLLAEVDASFVAPDAVDTGHGAQRPASREELAEAFSYLLHLFDAHIGLSALHFMLTAVDAGDDPKFRVLLDDALKICRYREAEVLLEAFPYQARTEGDAVRVAAIDPAFDRAIRLGYIQRTLQSNVAYYHQQSARDSGRYASLPLFAERYFEQLGDRGCRFVREPLARYVVELPIAHEIAKLFSQDAPFLEDWVGCASLALEEYLPMQQVPHQVVAGRITVLDLFKVQRVFQFVHHGIKRAIDRHEPPEARAGLYRASCLPVLSRERALSVLGLAVGAEKAAETLALLTADATAPGLDIQDAPVIAAGGYFMVAPAVLAASNLPRNILSRLHRRLVPAAPGRPDPMQSQLAQALRDAGFLVAVEFNLRGGKGDPLEADILAYRDGHLFVFECKNVYHPCNVYELRNTYNAMVEAAEQLSRRQAWLDDATHQGGLYARLAWPHVGPARVHSCVALGNRLFNGYACEGHPVRQVHELLNVLTRGTIDCGDGHHVRLWRGEAFEATDLVAYIEGSTTHADFAGAMTPVDVATPIGDLRLVLPTYALDLTSLKENILARYPSIA
jgi:hypothetical protein